MRTKEVHGIKNKQHRIIRARIVVKKPSEQQMNYSIINAIKETEMIKCLIDSQTNKRVATK